MAMTIEDILLERQRRNPTSRTVFDIPEVEKQDAEETAYVQGLIDNYKGPINIPAPPSAPSTADIYGEQIRREQEALRKQMVTPTPTLPSVPGPSSDAPIPIDPGVAPTAPTTPREIGKLSSGRPIVRNPDGSVSTHLNSIVTLDGTFYVIPTMFGGKQVSDQEAVDIIKKNKFKDPDTGQPIVGHKTLEEAEAAEEAAHGELEKEIQSIQGTPTSKVPKTPGSTTSVFNPQGALSLTKSMMQEAYGLGEAATSIASGFVAGGLGLGHYVEQIYRDRGPKSISQGIFDPTANTQEVPPNYWKNLREQAEKVAAEHTYVPRTEEGRRILGYTAPVFDALRAFSKMATDSYLVNRFLNDDQKNTVQYVHEILTAMALGEGIVTGVKGIRSTLGRTKVKEFQDAYVDASKEPEGGPATEKLARVAEEIKAKADASPEISAKFAEPAKTPAEIDTSLETIAKVKAAEGGAPLENPYKVVEGEGGKYGVTREGAPSPNQSPVDFSFNTKADAETYAESAWGREKTLAGEQAPLEELSPTPGIKTSRKSRAKKLTTLESSFREAEVELAKMSEEIPPEFDPTKYTPQQLGLGENDIIARVGERHTDGRISGISPGAEVTLSDGSTYTVAPMGAQITPGEIIVGNPKTGQSMTVPSSAVTKFKNSHTLGEVEIPVRDVGGTPTTPTENPYKLHDYGRGKYEVTREGIYKEAFTNKRTAERYIAREWKREQATPPERAVGDTIEDISSNPGKGTPSARSTEEILQASESSNAFMSAESTVKAIQKSLEDGTDISKELLQRAPNGPAGELAMMNYQNLKAIHEKGIVSSGERGLMAIMRDIAELMKFDIPPDKLGLFGNVSISTGQKTAAKRLLADVIKHFQNTGESSKVPFAKDALDQHMEDLGITPATRLLFRDYLDSLSTPVNPPSGQGPKSMPLDGSAMTNNPVVQSRITNDGLIAPRVFQNDLAAVQSANKIEISSQWASGELPSRSMKRANPVIHETISSNYRAAQKDIHTEVDMMHKDLRRIERLLSYKDKKDMTQAIQQGSPASLKGTPRQVYDILDGVIEADKVRIDEARNAIGNRSLNPIADNMEFMRAIQTVRSRGEGVNLLTIDPNALSMIIKDNSSKPMEPSFTQWATQKTLPQKFQFSSEKGIFRQFNDFETKLSEQINLTPLTAKVREIINGNHLNVVKMDGSKFNLEKENNGLYKVLEGWADAVDGKPVGELKVFQHNWDHVIRAFSESLGWSMLVGSVRSVLAQFYGLILTQHKAGMANTILASGDAIASIVGKSKNWDRMLATSDVITSRSNAPLWTSAPADLSAGARAYIAETLKGSWESFKEGRPREVVRAFSNMFLQPMEAADHAVAGISWLAHEKQGIKKGLSGEALKRYADEGVISTQASGWRGDMSPMQRSATGKALAQFGNVTFTEWDTLINDVIKPMKNEPLSTTFGKVSKLVGIMVALDLGSIFTGYDPPIPTPINDYMRSRKNNDSLLTTAVKVGTGFVAPYAPLFGKMTYGKGIGGPILGTVDEFVQGMLNRPGAHNLLEPVSELGGIPGSSTWWRIHRMKKSHPDTTVLQGLFAIRPDTQGSGGSLSSGLGGGLGKGSMKSNLK